ncbi:MAG: class I SAM-dependent methyltransferase [Acidobacteriota bacterium]
MARLIKIGILASLVVGGAAALVFMGRGPAAAPEVAATSVPQTQPSPPAEITIRNVTREAVTYRLKPDGSEESPVERRLGVGAVDRISARETMVVIFAKDGSDVSYSLEPGKPYSFRYDSAGKLDLWTGSHGREDAEDLAPYVPTPPEVVGRMMEMAKVGKKDVVYDIGCGDGRIVIEAARKHGCRGVGIDIDPARIDESRENAARAGVEALVSFRLEDATMTDISAATVVTLYLLTESNELLRPKFDRELKPGTMVVSHNYPIPGWEAKEIESTRMTDSEGKNHTIFLYRR